MAWGKNRRSPSSNSTPPPSANRSVRSPPHEPTDQDIARLIQRSKVRVRVSLVLADGQDEETPLRAILTAFDQHLNARQRIAVSSSYNVHVALLECGINTWQNLVELQRLLIKQKRPTEREEAQQLVAETFVHHHEEWTLSLSFAKASEEMLWKFTRNLRLKLKSCGVLSNVLLPSHRVTLLLLSGGTAQKDDVEMEKYQWQGIQVAHQLVVHVCGEERLVFQRVFLPRLCDSTRIETHSSELKAVVKDVLRCSASTRKPVVVILRGIPGSGKSTLKKEVEAMCRSRGIAFAACSADEYFETSRGYVFDAKKLKVAHSTCKRDFSEALLCQKYGVVVVDNTNTQRWEYEEYETLAKSHGCCVEILEVQCVDVWMAFRMGQRNAHGVPTEKVMSMFLRWENDSRSRCFPPYFDAKDLDANPLSTGKVGTVTYVGLFLDNSARKKLLAQIPQAHARKFADHVTLCYQPNTLYMREVELGASFVVHGVEVVQDNCAQALRVELDEQLLLPVRNKIPHITLSTSDNVNASRSNDLLESHSAKRTALYPPVKLTASLGAALWIQNQRMIIKTSPFAKETQDYSKCAFKKKLALKNQDELSNNVASLPIKVCAVYVNESDLRNDFEEVATSLSWMLQTIHHMGSQCNTHRLLCIQRSQRSSLASTAEILKSFQDCFFTDSTLFFDDLIVLPQPPSFESFQKAMQEHVFGANEFTLLTSVKESERWPISAIESLCDAAISVLYISFETGKLQSIPTYGSILSIMDGLGITTPEEIRYSIFRGVNVVKEALTVVYGTNGPEEVHRVDTTLVGLQSSVVELLILLPSGTPLSEVQVLKTKLASALEGRPCVHHVVRSTSLDQCYFCLCGASSNTPMFCVRMDSQHDNVVTTAQSQLHLCKQQLRLNRVRCNSEASGVLVALLRAILVRRCGDELPSTCRLSSLLNLTCERLVAHYLDSTDGVESMPTADDVVSGRIVFTLFNMLVYMSKLEPEVWAAAFGDSLLSLQGNEQAQITWRRAMAIAMQSSVAIVASYRRVFDELRNEAQVDPTLFFQLLVALIKTDRMLAMRGGSFTRTYVEVCTNSVWSPLHSLAFCDELRVAAATAWSHVDNKLNSDNANFFVCAPSLVTRRVNVTTSSLDVLYNAVEKVQAFILDVGFECEVRVGEEI